MCLSSVTKVLAGKGKKIYTAYKVFYSPFRSRKIHFEYRELNGNSEVHCNQWLKAERSLVFAPDGKYEAGFHCFTSAREAISWSTTSERIVRVRARGPLAIGVHNFHAENVKCVVYNEIFVPKPRKR